jgi:YHS domain-containing protein
MKTLLAGTLLALALSVQAQEEAAIKGYDPVAYFTEKRPVAGKPEYSATHQGAIYHFASAANRDEFLSLPVKYAPQYGGYCAFGVASGYKAPIEPDAWTVFDGKLYLNYNQQIRSRWLRDIPGHIRAADANWPKLR